MGQVKGLILPIHESWKCEGLNLPNLNCWLKRKKRRTQGTPCFFFFLDVNHTNTPHKPLKIGKNLDCMKELKMDLSLSSRIFTWEAKGMNPNILLLKIVNHMKWVLINFGAIDEINDMYMLVWSYLMD
jgi:hypothetical protein